MQLALAFNYTPDELLPRLSLIRQAIADTLPPSTTSEVLSSIGISLQETGNTASIVYVSIAAPSAAAAAAEAAALSIEAINSRLEGSGLGPAAVVSATTVFAGSEGDGPEQESPSSASDASVGWVAVAYIAGGAAAICSLACVCGLLRRRRLRTGQQRAVNAATAIVLPPVGQGCPVTAEMVVIGPGPPVPVTSPAPGQAAPATLPPMAPAAAAAALYPAVERRQPAPSAPLAPLAF